MNDKESNTKIVWLLLTVVSGAIAVYAEASGYLSTEPISIAVAKNISGEVSYRGSTEHNWSLAIKEQEFFNNQRIATGFDSNIKIQFKSGQTIQLEENSQIEIGRLKSRKGSKNTKFVTLIKGYVVVSGSPTGKILVKPKTGTEYLLQGKADEACLSREGAGSGTLECLTQGNKVRKKKRKYARKKLGRNTPLIRISNENRVNRGPEIKPLEEVPKAESSLSKLGEISAVGLEARMTSMPRSGSIIWSTRSFNEALNWSATISPPLKRPKAATKWTPLIEVLDGQGRSRNNFVLGNSNFQEQKIEIPIAKIKTTGTRSKVGPATDWSFQLRGGGKIQDSKSGKSKISFSNVKFRYQFRSLQDLDPGIIEIGLNSIRKSQPIGSWIYQKRILPQTTKYRILLQDRSDIPKMIPYLSSGEFYISKKKSPSLGNVFVARKLQIVASLEGAVDNALAASVRSTLNADFVFRGERASFFDPRNKSADDLQKWINSLLASGGQLYIMRNGKLFPISKNFVKNRSQILRFVGRNASYIFARKVDILDARNDL